ncbi:MAG: aldehyde ferredoxin oxidoreductase N-terminal domain-containing protein [Chloroflexota bacterium]|nr:aldehyde ferredoxin oxidoreductase N-terminal domain-containing protein [Chloroflexota bacterium]
MYGWTGKILRVDLSSGRVSHIDTSRYVPQLLGGLGVAAGIAWDELKPGVGPFDPENLLMVMVGPLTGTLASGAGRVEVAGIAPQQRPSRFSRSGMGGHWGPELKYAGFDGMVVQGKAPRPVYLWVHDGEVEVLDAADIWGTGTYATTVALRAKHGLRTRVISCGPAGERLSRIAIIQTETGSASGQGGYGAVMGSKNLKAIAVQGTGGVRIARPPHFLGICLNASREGMSPAFSSPDPRKPGGQPEYGPHHRTRKCGFCMTHCTHKIYMNVAAEGGSGASTAAQHCWGYDASHRAHIEGRALTSDYGINGWEVSYGIIPWLQLCRQHGLIDSVDGVEIPVPQKPIEYMRDCAPSPAEFLRVLLNIIAFRKGPLGDALADGACYAAERLFGGRGKPLLDRIYPRHAGQTEHWAGHWGPGGNIYWPWWLPVMLQWCVDTRDPANDSSHQWTSHVQFYLTQSGPYRGPFPLEKVRAVAAKVYGNPDVCDPAFEYDPSDTKAIPAIWHHHRGMIVDSLVLCDYENTRVFSVLSEDGAADTALMSKLFSACTGVETSERELDLAGERVFNLLRAIDIRNHGRDRKVDESTIGGFMYPGKDDGVVLDRERFLHLLDRYYELRGWNKANGWPARAKLEELGLKAAADELEAIGRLG